MNYVVETLKKYVSIKGRARRKEYWYFILFYVIVSFILSFISGLTGLTILQFLTLILLPPAITVGGRRMQDVGKPWWYSFIPIYGFILAIKEGDKSTNEYGPDPKKS
ncbi:DUF805 domain-containing protein [Flavobacterium collinsii]|uniref:Inner membrane protein YhaH n=1 Tax=Flavobacterium collinsii TaxID=1114861 RepID=A0A9W4TGI6_9FLAO|nr:DUF805 domain-containing protein [Flavobacterium collinsii]CAI2766766.1 Inner membrane protein YhaH [Flavobacterium collinsii]